MHLLVISCLLTKNRIVTIQQRQQQQHTHTHTQCIPGVCFVVHNLFVVNTLLNQPVIVSEESLRVLTFIISKD